MASKVRIHLGSDGLWYIAFLVGKSKWLPFSRPWVSRDEAARHLASNY